MDAQRRKLILGGGALLTTVGIGAGVELIGFTPVSPGAAAPPVRAPLAAPAVHTKVASDVRRLFLANLHTGETVNTCYWESGRHVQGALDEVRTVLRDWRTGDKHDMDPRLLDLLHDVSTRLETRQPLQIISGYRSPATNASLRARSSGVAKGSLHMHGMATDLRVQGVSLTDVKKAAASLGRGGVGYYPQSNFVHVDTGRVRQWAGA
jgi:uncharacterized protein YcbK (DUF882 family)